MNPGSCTAGPPVAGCLACGPDLNALLNQDAALAQAWAALRQLHREPGQLVAQVGDASSAIWRVESGLVRVFYLSPDGTERNRSFHQEGQWVGAGPMPRAQTMPYAIEALEPTTLTELPHTVLQSWAQRPDIQHRLTDALASALHQRDEREASLLLEDASQRYLAFMAREPALAARLPLHHVASHLGITNVALSRIRRRLGGR